MSMPYPDGSYTVTGTTFTFTVAAGIVTAADGSLTDTAAAGQPAAPPPVIPGPTLPMFEAMQADIKALQEENVKLKTALALAEKHEKILPDLFELAEKLTEVPASDPKTLNDKNKEKFNYAASRDERISTIAKTFKTSKNK
jgi:hypothetical protein